MQRTLKSFLAVTAAAVVLPACAPIPPAADSGMPKQAAVGSSFVRAMKSSGSYGTGETTVTFTRMPPRVWKGSEVGVWQQTNGPTLLISPSAAFVAFVNGETPLFSYEPPTGYDFPLAVGKTWTSRFNFVDHAAKGTFPVEARMTVEAYEDVTMPAGTFKGYRIRTADNFGNEDLRWYSTELGIWLKEKLVRTEKNPNGPGTRDTELTSQTIRK